MHNQEKYDPLLSTQVLHLGKILEAYRRSQGKKVLCKGCQKSFSLPPDMKKGHVKCQTCGAIYQVGVPSQYILIHCLCGKLLTATKKDEGKMGRCPGCGKGLQVPFSSSDSDKEERNKRVKVGIPDNMVRIACPCGKILTAPKEYLGKRGRCPKCSRILTVLESIKQETGENGSRETSDITLLEKDPKSIKPEEKFSFSGPIHFKCSCGQSHLVESYRVKEKIVCFRCSKEILVPFPDKKDSSIKETETPALEVWHIQIPYSEENFFSFLGLPYNCSLQEIKDSCRKIQSECKRYDEKFQKAQIIKDTLSHPVNRLHYEIKNEELTLCWKGLAPKKYLAIHDIALRQHREAIEWESQKRNYGKADPLWKKAIQNCLLFIQEDTFWNAAQQRGERLFEKKFPPDTVQKIRESFLKEVVVSVSCQFYERYNAEYNSIRSHCHKKFLLPVLQYLFSKDSQDMSTRNMLLEYYYEEINILLNQSQYKPAFDALLDAKNIFPNEAEIAKWIENFSPLLLPFLSSRNKAKLENFINQKDGYENFNS